MTLGLQQESGTAAAFSLADPAATGALLAAAGFGPADFAKVDEPMLIGRDVADVVEYERSSPSATGLLDGLSADQADALTRQVQDDVAPYATPDGVVMPGAAWLVTARAA